MTWPLKERDAGLAVLGDGAFGVLDELDSREFLDTGDVNVSDVVGGLLLLLSLVELPDKVEPRNISPQRSNFSRLLFECGDICRIVWY